MNYYYHQRMGVTCIFIRIFELTYYYYLWWNDANNYMYAQNANTTSVTTDTLTCTTSSSNSKQKDLSRIHISSNKTVVRISNFVQTTFKKMFAAINLDNYIVNLIIKPRTVEESISTNWWKHAVNTNTSVCNEFHKMTVSIARALWMNLTQRFVSHQ